MPIVFNEPLSFLQRIVEYMEYGSTLIEKASACSDPLERMEVVKSQLANCFISTLCSVHWPAPKIYEKTNKTNNRWIFCFESIMAVLVVASAVQTIECGQINERSTDTQA